MPFTQVTVTGSFPDAEGGAGTFTFQLTREMTNSGTVASTVAKQATVVNGSLSQVLDATDDIGTEPPDVQYLVTEQIAGAEPRSYFIPVPSASTGGTVDISTLMPGDPVWT